MLESISSLYKKGKLFYRLNRAKHKKSYKPVVALLFLTSRCNMKCSYCFAEHKGEFSDLKISEWKEIISELKRRGCELVFLMGGEPLLYNGFGELIHFVHSKGMQCHVTTNGLLVPDYIEELKHVDMLMVSLDGNKEGNDLNRGDGTFDKITAGIKAARDKKIPTRINCVLTKNNMKELEWLLNYGDELGAYVGFTIPARSKTPNAVKDILLDDNEIRKLHANLILMHDVGSKITLSRKSLKHVLTYPKPYGELIMKDDPMSIAYSECCYGRYIIFIDARGSIYPCTTLWEMPELFKAKNIFEDGWNAALENAQSLPCHICYCAGGVEWDYMSSIAGLAHAAKFSFGRWHAA